MPRAASPRHPTSRATRRRAGGATPPRAPRARRTAASTTTGWASSSDAPAMTASTRHPVPVAASAAASAPARRASQAGDLGAGHHVDAEAVELRGERVDQSVHAAAQAEHGGAGLALLEQLADAARERAHAGHRLVEAGRHDVEVEVVGVRGVDAGGDRGHEAIEHGVAHAVAHELPEAVGATDREDRLEPIEVGAPRPAPADDAAHVLAERIRGDARACRCAAGARRRAGRRDRASRATRLRGSASRCRRRARAAPAAPRPHRPWSRTTRRRCRA